jgi:hypothetical protein
MMKSTSKTLVLAAVLGVGLTTALAAMVGAGNLDRAAPKGDRLAAPAVSLSGHAIVEPGDGNTTIVTRPEV